MEFPSEDNITSGGMLDKIECNPKRASA